LKQLFLNELGRGPTITVGTRTSLKLRDYREKYLQIIL